MITLVGVIVVPKPNNEYISVYVFENNSSFTCMVLIPLDVCNIVIPNIFLADPGPGRTNEYVHIGQCV